MCTYENVRQSCFVLQISNVENLSPQTIRRLVKEQEEIIKDPPEGIRIFVNEADVTDIQGYINGPG